MSDPRRAWSRRGAAERRRLTAMWRRYVDGLPSGRWRWPAYVGSLALAFATVGGAIALGHSVSALIGALVLGLVAVLAVPVAAEVLACAVGATIVGVLALVGFDALLAQVWDPPIVLGLALAIAVVGAAAAVFVRLYAPALGWGSAAAAGLALGAVFVLVPPWVIGAADEGRRRVPVDQAVASRVDVFVVLDRTAGPAGDAGVPDPDLRGFDVHYSVGIADRGAVRWRLIDSPDEHAARAVAAGEDPGSPSPEGRLAPRPQADPVLLLVPDGTPASATDPAALPVVPGTPGEFGRWRALARTALTVRAPTFAYIQAPVADPERPRRRQKGFDNLVPGARAVSVQALGSPTLTDAGLRLAVGDPGARADFSLAVKYRPAILFDRDEPVPRPLSVQDLFARGQISLCEDGGRTSCRTITDPKTLVNGRRHLEIARPRGLRRTALAEARAEIGAATPAAGAAVPSTTDPGPARGDGSAIYVHAVSGTRAGRRLLYLDYWWYLPENPAAAGGGAFCGPGLVIGNVTCFDHESDWEGITVVIDRSGRGDPKPIAVQYAQHDAVVRYDWAALQAAWRTRRVQRLLRPPVDVTVRPLAFSARGTHATYPVPCTGDSCSQVAESGAGEEGHDGGLPWSGNARLTCGDAACVLPLPTRAGGQQPALWNAFEGVWGRRRCVLSFYCNSTSPPSAPGRQDRFAAPGAFDGRADPAGRHFEAGED